MDAQTDGQDENIYASSLLGGGKLTVCGMLSNIIHKPHLDIFVPS